MERLVHRIDRVPIEMYIRATFVQDTQVTCRMSSNQTKPLERMCTKESLRRLYRHLDIRMLTGVLLLSTRKQWKQLKYQQEVAVCIMAYP